MTEPLKKVLMISAVVGAVVIYYIFILPNIMFKPAPTPTPSTTPTPAISSGIGPAVSGSPAPVQPSAEPTGSSAPIPVPSFAPTPVPTDIKSEKIKVSSPLLDCRFSTLGGALEAVRLLPPTDELKELGFKAWPATADRTQPMPVLESLLKDVSSLRIMYNTDPDPTKVSALAADLANYSFTLDGRTLILKSNNGYVVVERTYRLSENGYDIEMLVSFTNFDSQPQGVSYAMVGSAGVVPDGIEDQRGTIQAHFACFDTNRRLYIHDSATVGNLPEDGSYKFFPPAENSRLDWVAGSSQFFSLFLDPDDAIALKGAFARRLAPQRDSIKDLPTYNPGMPNIEVGIVIAPFTLQPNETVTHKYSVLPSPKYLPELGKYAARDYHKVVSFGFFGLVARLILTLLEGIAFLVTNYGVAIIVLALLLQVALHPLTRKQYVSMNKLQKLQPLIAEAQKRFKGDSRKLGEVTMAIYQRTGVNPLGGCLPMLVQLPVFFALYSAFYSCIELREASFLWVPDLSGPERISASWLPFGLVTINILPIAMTVVWVIQSSLSPKPSDPQQMMTYRIMQFMPLIFFFIFYDMPSGLVLYWLVRNLFSIFETLWIKSGIRKKEAAGAFGFEKLTLDAILKEQKIEAKKKK